MAIVLKKAQFGTYQELSSFTAQLRSQKNRLKSLRAQALLPYAGQSSITARLAFRSTWLIQTLKTRSLAL